MEPEPEPPSVGPRSVPSRVTVAVFSGRSLPVEDWDTGKADPYVEMRVLCGEAAKPTKSEKHTSSTQPQTLEPVWDPPETFQLMDSMGPTDQAWVRLKVWDHDHLAKDDFIGMADVPLLELLAAPAYTVKRDVELVNHKGQPVAGKDGRATIAVEVRAYYNEDTAALVREHSVLPHSGLAKWFFKDEGVEKFYTIAEELGSGSFAVVKKGIRKTDGAEFAIKYIDKTVLKKDDEAMLESECAVLKQVNHPNIVRLFEIYYTPEKLILVMEFVDGGEMLEKLKEAERYNEMDAAQTVHKITEALVYIHEKGIAHRDLKPENLLLTHGDEAVKIVDFGFAKILKEEGELLHTACGTPEYVAPEILQQQGYLLQATKCVIQIPQFDPDSGSMCDISVLIPQSSAKPRVMNPQNSTISPEIALKLQTRAKTTYAI